MFRLSGPVWAYFGRILIKPFVIAGLGVSMLYQGYQVTKPAEDSLGFMRRNLAERVCAKAAGELPMRNGAPTLAVLNLAGDPTGFVTSQLKSRIEAAGGYRIVEESFLRKLLREFGKEDAPVSKLKDAVDAARRLGVDAVVFGEIPEFTSSENSAAIKLELRMAERESGQAIFAQSYSEGIGGGRTDQAYWRARLADSSKGRRIFIWIAFTLLLPLVTVPLIRRLTAEESNMLNLGLLIGYTAVDMFLALLLTGFWIPTLWSAGLLILALAASAYYNYLIASFIEEMRH